MGSLNLYIVFFIYLLLVNEIISAYIITLIILV